MLEIAVPATWPAEDLCQLASHVAARGGRLWCLDALPEADAFVTLAMLAHRNGSVALGAGGLRAEQRHPVLLFGAALTLEEMTGCPVALALAPGEASAEAHELLQALNRGGRRFKGAWFQLDEASYPWGSGHVDLRPDLTEVPQPAILEEALTLLG